MMCGYNCTNTQTNKRSNINGMALLRSSLTNKVRLRLVLYPLGSNIVTRTACCSVGIVLPVYSTFKAIERKDQDEQQKWLIYWAAYGSFSIAEVFADKLLSWFPMYYHLKFAFLVWLQLPSADGASQLYRNHLCPFLFRHQARVGQLVTSAFDEVVKLSSTHQAEIELGRNMILKVFWSDQPEGRNAIEGPAELTTDAKSDHDHEHNHEG